MTAPGGRSVFRVGIGANALRDATANRALLRAVHEDLLDNLRIHGRITFPSGDDMSAFIAAVRSLPPTLAKAWETLLTTRRISVEVADPAKEPGLDEVLDATELERRYGGAFELALLDSDQAELIGVSPDDYSMRTPRGHIEIGRVMTATHTETVRAARSVMAAPLREGANREDEWEQRLGPLVAAGAPIVIYDKYVGMQVARRYVHQHPSGDGLTWLMHRISMTPGRRVRVITAVPFKTDEREPIDEAALQLGFGRMKQALGRPVGLDLVLVPERTRDGQHIERFGHDRHIRFGHRAAIALGMGIQSFAAKRFTETITVALLAPSDAKQREERAVRAALRPPPEGWLGWLRAPAAPEAPGLR